MKVPAFHAIDIEVRANKPLPTKDISRNGLDHYENRSVKETPQVAHGIVTPLTLSTIQTANLTDKPITIHRGQAISTMTRLYAMQINTIYQARAVNAQPTVPQSLADEPTLIDTDLNDRQKEAISRLIRSFPDIFKPTTGRTQKLKHQIDLLPGSKPCNSALFRYAPGRRQIIDENLKEMTERGVIIPSKSPCACPVVLTPKKRWHLPLLCWLPQIKCYDNPRCLSNTTNRWYARLTPGSAIRFYARPALRILASGNE